MAQHNLNGQLGEELAIKYLTKSGYKILEKNWNFRHKEIDIIAKNDDFIVFVEVKFRSYVAFGEPYTAVNRKKQQNIIEAAHEYILRKNIDDEARFDIISVSKTANGFDINHIESAFRAY